MGFEILNGCYIGEKKYKCLKLKAGNKYRAHSG